MAITFTEQKKRQRYLIVFLAFTITAAIFVFWWGFFREKEPSTVVPEIPVVYPKQEIKIDWDLLEDDRFESFQTFPEIPVFEGDAGRDNPFLPY